MWTENRTEAARITALGEDEFHSELERRFGLHLGEIKALDKPRRFRSAISSRARSSRSGWRWSATPRM